MGTKFALASLAPQIIQLFYVQKFFVCMQKAENKFFIFPWYRESIFYFYEGI